MKEEKKSKKFNKFFVQKPIFARFSAFYGQRSVAEPGLTLVPGVFSSFSSLFHSLLLTHFRDTQEAEILFPFIFWHN